VHNEKYPENKLQFFPTDEEWTLTTRPDKIPLENRFPQCYAVNSLQTTTTSKCPQQRRQPTNKQKQPAKQPSNLKHPTHSGEPNSIERYLTHSQPTATPNSDTGTVGAPVAGPSRITRKEGVHPMPDYLKEPASASRTDASMVEHLLSGKTIPGSIPGWD
jgi:hypothetical protein